MSAKTKSKSKKAQETEMPPLRAEGMDEQAADASLPKPDLDALEHEITTLKEQLAAEQEKAASHWDRLLRKEAELQNSKKRADQAMADARRFAISGFAESLLVVLDSLEKGLEVAQASEADDAIIEGIRLTYEQFLDILTKNQVETLNPEGQAFDPKEHEALSMVPTDQVPANQIVEVIQRGYRLHDRLLRPAKVIVAKAP